MYEIVQTLWDQMREDLGVNHAPQMQSACQALLSGELGPLTDLQSEDLQSVDRSFEKLVARINGEPINWSDFSEAAHALRGPLNATIGFSRLIVKGIDGPITEEQKEPLENIHAGSRVLLALFNLLLDLLMFEHGDLDINTEPLPANEVLDELIAVGQTLAARSEFSFQTEVDAPAAAMTIRSNKKRLQQALLALLAVSTKHSQHDVSTLRAWLDQDNLFIQLENQGCQQDMPLPSDLSLLLTDQAPPNIPYDVHLRLGLARRLLEDMDGGLEINQIGQKCTFTVTIPIA
jgi:signal transduction histidine kinase